MKRYSKILTWLFIVALAAAFYGMAQQKSEETAIDPVCKMTVKIAGAKITADYKGKTYYFCAEGCKTKFLADPEKYLQKPAEEAPKGMMPHGKMGAGMMHGQRAQEGGMSCCGTMGGCMMMRGMAEKGRMGGGMMHRPMMMKMMHGRMGGGMGMMGCADHACLTCLAKAEGVEIAVENTKDGAKIQFTAKDAEVVKKIQKVLADLKAGCEGCGEEGCPAKKDESKVQEQKKK